MRSDWAVGSLCEYVWKVEVAGGLSETDAATSDTSHTIPAKWKRENGPRPLLCTRLR